MNRSKGIYLDNAASTRPYPEVIARMKEILDMEYGNSSSAHKMGVEAHRIIKKAAETLADILNCRPDEIVLTSGGSEANNLAVKGYAFANLRKRKKIITSAFEHPTVLNTVKNLDKFGFETHICSLDENGLPRSLDIIDNVDENTLLVSIMTVNSETGAYIDMGALSKKIKSINPGTAVHTDAVQAFAKLPLDMAEWRNVDMLSMSSHKIKGPKGAGALFIRKGTVIDPIIDGGSHQLGRRAGTEDTAGIAGFALAAKMFAEESRNYFKKVSALNEYLRNKLTTKIDGMLINSPEGASPYIVNVAFRDIRSETLLNHLSGKGIYVSAGSACSSRKKSNSHVLEAMHVPKKYIEGALRISFSPMNHSEELDLLIGEIIAILPMLRKTRRK